MKRLLIPFATLVLGLTAVTGVAAGITYATVTGHEAFSEDANKAEYWGEDCTKDESVDGSATIELPEGFFGTVIVKSGSGEFANTIFEGASGGETVFADTNGNFTYDPDGPGGDKEISHVILCEEEQPTDEPVTESPTDEPVTDEPTDEPVTDEPVVTNPPDESLPPTDTGSSQPAGNMVPILLLALGLLLGSIVVLTPRRR